MKQKQFKNIPNINKVKVVFGRLFLYFFLFYIYTKVTACLQSLKSNSSSAFFQLSHHFEKIIYSLNNKYKTSPIPLKSHDKKPMIKLTHGIKYFKVLCVCVCLYLFFFSAS